MAKNVRAPESTLALDDPFFEEETCASNVSVRRGARKQCASLLFLASSGMHEVMKLDLRIKEKMNPSASYFVL